MAPPSALRASPIAPDQLALIERLLRQSSPEQVQWLSGYLAGFQAGLHGPAHAPAPAAPPSPRVPLTILYATESGNAAALARAARKEAQRAGFAASLLDMADTAPDRLPPGPLLVIAATWGEGDPPQRAEPFIATLLAPDAPRLEGRRFAVLALGDRAYANFCATGRSLDARLAALGAARIAPLQECDLDYAAPARTWSQTVLAALAPPAAAGDAAVIRVDFARPAPEQDNAEDNAEDNLPETIAAELTLRQLLSSSRSTSETWHLELDAPGFAWEPGDAVAFSPRNDPALVSAVLEATGLADDAALRADLTSHFDITTLTTSALATHAALTGQPERPRSFLEGRQLIDLLEATPARLSASELAQLLRPLPPRLYSIASAPVAGSVHLLVSAVRWQSHERGRAGVASIDLVSRRAVAKHLPLTLSPNPHFRLPDDPDRPIIMIGPGTGLAPFRAFLQRREAAGQHGKSWLFFGARNFTHDFLYQLEVQEWRAAGVLTDLSLAFSRDQPEKIYVQHRMWEQREQLWRWLDDGAVLYVCGDARAMARDVHATLIRIISDATGCDADASAAWLRAAITDGRYKRDVY
ncbi:MAG: diflavin oxidoreductase [Acetobacteraceae bacterium]